MISDDNSAMPETESDTSTALIPQSSENIGAVVTADRRQLIRTYLYATMYCLRVLKLQGESIFIRILLHVFEPFELDLVEYPHMKLQPSCYKYVLNCLTEAQFGDKCPYPDDPWCYDQLKSVLLELGRPPPDQEIDALYEGTNFSNLAPSAGYNRLIAIITASRKQLADKPILHEILLHRFLKYLPLEIAMILRMTSKHTDLREALLAAEQAFRPASFNQTLNSMSSDSLNRTRTSLTATDASRIAQQLSCA